MPLATRIRVIPRVVAHQLAKDRADLYLHQKFFEEILEGIAAKDPGVLADAIQVPGHLNDIRKTGKEAIHEWAVLSQVTSDPKAHYRAALQRAVRQLSRTGADPERLEAYEALLSGKATDDLKKLLGDLEKIAANIIQKVKDRKKLKDRPRIRRRDDSDEEVSAVVSGATWIPSRKRRRMTRTTLVTTMMMSSRTRTSSPTKTKRTILMPVWRRLVAGGAAVGVVAAAGVVHGEDGVVIGEEAMAGAERPLL
ncbi:MAG: hypothetical protein WC763_07520 [Candidatus Paceibacterota bacterium]|jgi:hypothetical protein